MTMKSRTWICLSLCLASACGSPPSETATETAVDPDTVDETDTTVDSEVPTSPSTTSSSSSSGTDTSAGAETGDESTGGFGCNDGGPPTYLYIDLGPTPIPPGAYAFTLETELGDFVESCSTSVPDGGGCGYYELEGEAFISLTPSPHALQEPMRLRVTADEVTILDEVRQFEHDVSSGGCWSSGTGTGAIELGALRCDALEPMFDEAVEAVRGCTEASECGTVIPGFTCGCTLDWVGRLDADPEALTEVAQIGLDGGCGWVDSDSRCDCPPADGFACVDNLCTWNYSM